MLTLLFFTTDDTIGQKIGIRSVMKVIIYLLYSLNAIGVVHVMYSKYFISHTSLVQFQLVHGYTPLNVRRSAI